MVELGRWLLSSPVIVEPLRGPLVVLALSLFFSFSASSSSVRWLARGGGGVVRSLSTLLDPDVAWRSVTLPLPLGDGCLDLGVRSGGTASRLT